MRLDDINLLDKDVFAKGVPHEWFTSLRERSPVFRHPGPDGIGFWVVTKHVDVRAVSRDPHTFASPTAPLGDAEAPVARRGTKVLLAMDPPEHTRHRKLVNHGFTPRMISPLEGHIRDLTVQILDRAIDQGVCDFVVDVAAELPVEVIAELIGVPREDRHKLVEWTNRVVGAEDPEYFTGDDPMERAKFVEQANTEMLAYTQALCEQRRGDPRGDIMSELLDAEIEGEQLSDYELAAFFQFLSFAGNDTTRNSAAHGVWAFMQNPHEWEKLRADPEGLSASAVEEILRWASPVMHLGRRATHDVELGGQQLKAGDNVSIWYVSANRDEDVFADPFRFDIERHPNDHIAFGGGGPHFCLGASLARLELRVLFEELARRVPLFRPTGTPEYLRSNIVAGVKHLPIDLSAPSTCSG
jgi:cholest-4-en-3-one 26-monooxygenase